MATGGTFKEISKANFEKLSIPFPSVEVQKQVVEEIEGYQKILDSASTIIDTFNPTVPLMTDVDNVKLGDLVNIIGGGTPDKSNIDFYSGSIRWATVRDMNVSFIDDTMHHINEKAVKASATNIIPANNVVIATRVGLGKVSWLNHDTAINQDLKALIPKNDSIIDKKYLMYVIESLAPLIINSGTGATVKGVTIEFIKELKIPLPTLTEQKQIVEDMELEHRLVDNNKKLMGLMQNKINKKIAEIWNE